MVIVSHETKEAYEQSDGSHKSFTTSLMCGNGAGEILSPLIVYSTKNLNPQRTFGEPSGASYAVSESGWISTNLFIEWFKWFGKYRNNILKPILLLMDNHPCHISIDVIELAKQIKFYYCYCHQIVYTLQPLDTATFNVAKQIWKKNITKYFLRIAKIICKIDIPGSFNQLCKSALTSKQVVAGSSLADV